jgi:hypothetical protein
MAPALFVMVHRDTRARSRRRKVRWPSVVQESIASARVVKCFSSERFSTAALAAVGE